MTHALKIDTLTFSKRLRQAGADERLAEAIVEGLTGADTSELSTKTDVAEVRSELKTEIAGLRSELKTEIAEVRTEIAGLRSELKTEIADVRTEIAEVRTELKTESAGIRTEVAGLRTELKAEIAQTSNRTVYILGGLIGFLIVIDRILPLFGFSQ